MNDEEATTFLAGVQSESGLSGDPRGQDGEVGGEVRGHHIYSPQPSEKR